MQNARILSILAQWPVELNESLMQSKSFCIALFNTNKQLEFCNPAFEALLEESPVDSFINPTFSTLLEAENTSSVVFSGYLTLGNHHSISTSIVAQVYRKQNQLLIVGGVDTAQLVEQNKTMHQLNREISSLQRELIKKTNTLENTLKQLNQANAELEQQNTDQDRFLRIISHDLRNPFHSILGLSGLLLQNIKRYDSSKIEKLTRAINTTTNRAFKLLNDLVLWSKSNAGKLIFQPTEINFCTICNDEIYGLENKKNIRINYPSQQHIPIVADSEMLKTIVRNLVSNALKFTPENGQIDLSIQQTPTQSLITVADNGVGISTEDQAKIWNMASMYSTYGTAGEKGTGFGLMLCKEFVEKHGGTIWVESIDNQGSKFKFTIPHRGQ